jgi:hypothetical protein
MANFHREPDRRQSFLLPVDMADWVPDTDLVHLLLDASSSPLTKSVLDELGEV